MAFDADKIIRALTSGREFLRTVSGGRINTDAMPAPVGFLLDTVANPATLASSLLFPGSIAVRLAMAAGTAVGGRLASEVGEKTVVPLIPNEAGREVARLVIPVAASLAAMKGFGGSLELAAGRLPGGPAPRRVPGVDTGFQLPGGFKPIQGAASSMQPRVLDTDIAKQIMARKASGPKYFKVPDKPVRPAPSPEYESRMIERMKDAGIPEVIGDQARYAAWISPRGRTLDLELADRMRLGHVSHSKAAGVAEGRGPVPVDDFSNPYMAGLLRQGWIRKSSRGSYMVWDTDDPQTLRRLERVIAEDRPNTPLDPWSFRVESLRGGAGSRPPLTLTAMPGKPFRFPSPGVEPGLVARMRALSAVEKADLPPWAKEALRARPKTGQARKRPPGFYTHEGD